MENRIMRTISVPGNANPRWLPEWKGPALRLDQAGAQGSGSVMPMGAPVDWL